MFVSFLSKQNGRSTVTLFSAIAAAATSLIVFGAATQAHAAPSRPIALEDYFELQDVDAPQISPDGSSVVYTRSRILAQEDRAERSLRLMKSDGSAESVLTHGGQPAWSPDSRSLAYTAMAQGREEIFVRSVASDDAGRQLTRGGLRPQNLAWSPDGQWIAFRGTVPFSTDWKVEPPGRTSSSQWAPEPTIIEDFLYRTDSGGLNPGYRHLFIVSVADGSVRQLTQGKRHVGARLTVVEAGGELRWMPDSRAVVFSANFDSDHEMHFRRATLYAASLSGGEPRKLIQPQGFWIRPRPSPDGARIAFVGSVESKDLYPPQGLYVADKDGGNARALITELPGDLRSLFWDRRGGGLFYTVEDRGSINVNYVGLDGKRRAVTTGEQVLSLDSVSLRGIAVGTRTTSDRPAEVFRLDLNTGRAPRQLTHINERLLANIKLRKAEALWYDSSDGTRAQGWVLYPPRYDATKKYPLALYVRGGPMGMFDTGFVFRHQEMAAAGYIVLYTNPRGSSGYGAAHANAIQFDYPGRRAMDDLLSAVNAVIRRGSVDEKRLYAIGASAGGKQVTWMVGETHRFAAVVGIVTATNNISQAGSADTGFWHYAVFEKTFWEDPSEWLARSSLMQAPKIRTPVLLIAARNDLRTPVSQSEELYAALKLHQVPTRLVILNSESHGWPRRPSNVLRTQLLMRKWFDEHAK